MSKKVFKNEYDFIQSLGDRLGEYVGQGIAIVDNKIVAKGDNAGKVYRKAKEYCPTKVPFIMKVPQDKVMVL
ncbi:MAG: succinyl-CoA synthetase subunit alpha [Nitrososphaeria archaeon]|nr:succinyl-CoA synthetase subunit alpha [Nitrososphaeria archaeon]